MSPVHFYGAGKPKDAYIDLLHAPAVAIDTETVSLDNPETLCFAVTDRPDRSFVFEMEDGQLPRDGEFLTAVMANPNVVKIGHNWLYDLTVMPHIHRVMDFFSRTRLWDTNVAARLQGEPLTALPVLAPDVGKWTEPAKDIMKRYKTKTFRDVPIGEVNLHCSLDVEATMALYQEQVPWVAENLPAGYFDIEMQAVPIITDIGAKGLLIDHEELDRLMVNAKEELQDHLDRCHRMCPQLVNPNSTPQTIDALIKRGNYLPPNKKRTNVTTDKIALAKIKDPLAAAITLYRSALHDISTYLSPVMEMDRWPNRYTFETGVGRLSSRDRNTQNIPEKLRSFLIPDYGMWTMADYKMEHMFILMEFSEDREMQRVLREGYAGGDIHTFTASRLFNVALDDVAYAQRKLAKTVNYAIAYGATAETLMESSGSTDKVRCQWLLDEWFRIFHGAARWIEYAKHVGMTDGWSLPTVFGRRVKIQQERKDAMERKCVNYPILGSDGEVCKRGVIRLAEMGLGPPVLSILVHDEYVLDGDVVVPVEELENLTPFTIPIDVKQVARWE